MFSPLRSYPGPKLWAISTLPSAISILRGRSHTTMLAMHNKYGPVVRIAPNELSFNSPGAYQDIYMPRSGRPPFGKHPRIYACKLNGVRDSIIGTLDHDLHGKQRRLLSHAFSDRYLREQEGIIVSFVDMLISQLRKQINPKKNHTSKADISGWMNFTTFDIMGELMFAETFDCLNDSKLHPWISLVFASVKGITLVAVMNQFSLIWAASEFLLPEYLREQMLRAVNVTAEKADRRIKKGTTRPDIMSALLKNGLIDETIPDHDLSDKKDSSIKDQPIMTRAEIHSNAMLIIMAGSETTASLLSGCIYYLCKNPICMTELCNEIRSEFSADEDITAARCAPLKYLNAVIEESFRLYPPVATVLLRVVPEGGDTVDGYVVPENTTVSTHHYASYRSAANFALPEQFIPERWLGNDERFNNDKRDALQPFSLGPREIRLIVAKLLFNFDIELCKESENWVKQDVYTIWNKPALMVQLHDRFHE
ncbi:hypothetical protein N7466_006047 [Penicillium verhagenii]|uniref:uncharacterized protein n=1 Tax=Penicillium verhagenii TaxID=1562060 RepID=UPI002544FEBE|nr:uncharacterized protein N7466_006047 [Penicillium verhagenii]KAJ5930554.1 hypothetical protein N7466_006047 [Penicillium verhagenii]